MKKKLRLISLSLMLAMIAGTAVSCNSKGEQTETTEGDTTVVNLTMYEWGWEGPEEGMDEVAPLIKEATGVEINLSRWIVNSEEDYRRQMSLWTSANTLPEMMTVPADNYTTQLVNELGDAGRLWEVDILLDKVFEEAKESFEDSMTLYQSQDTGKKYFYPTQNGDYEAQIEQDNIAQCGIMIRKDWLDEQGVGYPQTPDELYTVLKRFKEEIKLENGQTVIPVTFNEGQSGLSHWQAMFFDRTEDRPGLWRKTEDGTYTNQYDLTKLTNYAEFMNMTILFKIYLPLSLPSLATLTLFCAVGHWNSWFDGMIYMSSQTDYPLQTYLQSLMVVKDVNTSQLVSKDEMMQLAALSDKTVRAAQIFIATLPILLVYPFVQRFFMKGLVIGSVKG